MCATPFGVRSTLSKVVGFVLAAMLLKVRGSERYEEEDLEGDGDGGVLGGIGRNEASSSASNALVGDQVESRATEETIDPSSSSLSSLPSSSPPSFRDIVLRLVCVIVAIFIPSLRPFEDDVIGADITRSREPGPLLGRPVPIGGAGTPSPGRLVVFTVPANLR